MKSRNDELFGNIWTFLLSQRTFYGADYDTVSQYVLNKEALINRTAVFFMPFKNLDTVGYYEPHRVSRRYEKIFAINNLTRFSYERMDRAEEEDAYKGLQIGLDVLLRALQRGKIQPKTFTLPSPAFNLECFTAIASPQLFRDVLKATQKLCIIQTSGRHLVTLMGFGQGRGDLELMTETPKNHTEIRLTHDNFPSLRDLVVNIQFDMEARSAAGRTSTDNDQPVSEPAHLEHLTLRYSSECKASAYLVLRKPDSINRFVPHLRRLTVINALHWNWNALLKSLAKMLLDSLEVCVEPSVYENVVQNEVRIEDTGLFSVYDNFRDAANECTIKPQWVMDLVGEVWRDQERTCKRLEEDSDEAWEFDWDVSDVEAGAMEE